LIIKRLRSAKKTGMRIDLLNIKFSTKGGKEMKKLFKKFETAMTAVAFAEAGEFDTARQIMNEDRPRKTDRPSDRKRPVDRKIMRAD